jgi:hypothetical protein
MRIARTASTVLLLLAASGSAQSQGHDHHAASSEQLGTVHFQTSCSPSVSAQIDRAVALLHSFEFGASIKAFSDVAGFDSTARWRTGGSR